MKHRLGLTPGTPRFVVMRVTEHQDKLGTKEYATYRSGVGTLLHLTKHSRPDLCNTVGELLKTLDKPAPIHFKNVQDHQIYVVATKRQELRFYHNGTEHVNWLYTVRVIMQVTKKQV